MDLNSLRVHLDMPEPLGSSQKGCCLSRRHSKSLKYRTGGLPGQYDQSSGQMQVASDQGLQLFYSIEKAHGVVDSLPQEVVDGVTVQLRPVFLWLVCVQTRRMDFRLRSC